MRMTFLLLAPLLHRGSVPYINYIQATVSFCPQAIRSLDYFVGIEVKTLPNQPLLLSK